MPDDYFTNIGRRCKELLPHSAPKLVREAPDYLLGLFLSVVWAAVNPDDDPKDPPGDHD